jgi:hypothetical protein
MSKIRRGGTKLESPNQTRMSDDRMTKTGRGGRKRERAAPGHHLLFRCLRSILSRLRSGGGYVPAVRRIGTRVA